MSTNLDIQDQEAVRRITEKYQRDGYQVVGESELPPELQPCRPDLVVRKGNELIVIEVARASAPRRPGYWSALAERIYGKHNWHFRIVVLGDDKESLALRPLPTLAELRARLERTRSLLQEGESQAALLLAWSLLEAAARLRMLDDDGDPARATTPASLIKGLVHLGYLDEAQAESIASAMKLRNAIAHGFVGELSAQEVTDAAQGIIDAVTNLIPADPA